MMHIFQ